MIKALLIVDGEAGRILIMEGATGLPLAPRALQFGGALDERGQGYPALEFIQPLRGKRHRLLLQIRAIRA